MKSGGFCSAVLLALMLALMLVAPVAAGAQDPGEDENIPPDRITIHQLKRKIDAGEDIVIIDARKGSSYTGSTVKIKGAIHITADELEAKIKDLPRKKEIIIYCT